MLQLYLHHVVPNPEFLQGEGAEVRGSTLRKAFPAPYAYVVNGSRTDEYDIRWLYNLKDMPENA